MHCWLIGIRLTNIIYLQPSDKHMAIGKRSLMNEHMITVLNKVRSMDPDPVQKSYLYYSQAEKEAVDYMIAIDLLKEKTFEDDGSIRKGYVLGDFGKEVIKDITRIQMKIDLQERIFEDPSQGERVSELIDIRRELNSTVDDDSEERMAELRKMMAVKESELMEDYQRTVDRQIEELDSRGQKKMDTISKWKQQRKGQ